MRAKRTYKPRRQNKVVRAVSVEVAESQILYNVHQAARVLSISEWSVREFINSGVLPTVALPSTKGRAARNRRVLISRADLDQFVARYRPTTASVSR